MVYDLKGRIDSTNAEAFEKDLMSFAEGNGKLEINAEKLEYISSAGLRVLLKLRKKQDELLITNVSPEVYEIFDVTGFTEMLTVKKALRKVSVAGCEELGHGGHGRVYRLDGDTIIKTYTDGSSLEEIDRERMYGRNAFVNGVPCAIAFDVVQTEQGLGVVFEMAGAKTVAAYVTEHPKKAEECGCKMGEMLKKLNSTPADPTLYGDIREIYKERLENAKEYFTEEENKKLLMLLDAIPDGDGMIHGDYHPNNVMVQSDGELILIDMADISRGNALFDIGGAYLTMVQAGARDHSVTKFAIGIDYDLSITLWNSMLKTYLGTDDEKRIAMVTQQFGSFCLLRMASTLGMSETARERADSMVPFVREYLLANAEGICQLFKMPLA